MLAIASIPIIAPFILLLVLKQSGLRTSFIASLLAILLSLFFVKSTDQLLPLTLLGTINAVAIGFGILTVLYPGLLLYRLQFSMGNLDTIAKIIRHSFKNKDIQVLAIVIGISTFVETVSGFGVSILIVVPLLISLGFSSFKAGALSLLSQISVPLGALGVGTMIGAQLASLPVNEIAVSSLIYTVPLPSVFSLWALYLIGGKHSIKRKWGFAITLGLIKGGLDLLLTYTLGLEIAGALSSIVVIIFAYLSDRYYYSKTHEVLKVEYISIKESLKATAPYIILLGCLIITRSVSLVHNLLFNNFNIHIFENPIIYPIFYIPGFWVLVSALSIIVFNRLSLIDFWSISYQTWKQFYPAGLTILFFLLLAQIMILSGMAETIAISASLFGGGFLIIVPIMGALSGWLTASNSGGNAMFVPLHIETANLTGLPLSTLTAAQNAASAYGTMGSPGRIALVCATTSDRSLERKLIKFAIPLVIISTLIIIIIVYVTTYL